MKTKFLFVFFIAFFLVDVCPVYGMNNGSQESPYEVDEDSQMAESPQENDSMQSVWLNKLGSYIAMTEGLCKEAAAVVAQQVAVLSANEDGFIENFLLQVNYLEKRAAMMRMYGVATVGGCPFSIIGDTRRILDLCARRLLLTSSMLFSHGNILKDMAWNKKVAQLNSDINGFDLLVSNVVQEQYIASKSASHDVLCGYLDVLSDFVKHIDFLEGRRQALVQEHPQDSGLATGLDTLKAIGQKILVHHKAIGLCISSLQRGQTDEFGGVPSLEPSKKAVIMKMLNPKKWGVDLPQSKII